ncbi:hypothetical protein KAR91_20185 [Candidatus Pacearchaeota archaeon]|nr:hypothetical protein [Candidatus Pacearchaeota archaeon]
MKKRKKRNQRPKYQQTRDTNKPLHEHSGWKRRQKRRATKARTEAKDNVATSLESRQDSTAGRPSIQIGDQPKEDLELIKIATNGGWPFRQDARVLITRGLEEIAVNGMTPNLRLEAINRIARLDAINQKIADREKEIDNPHANIQFSIIFQQALELPEPNEENNNIIEAAYKELGTELNLEEPPDINS